MYGIYMIPVFVDYRCHQVCKCSLLSCIRVFFGQVDLERRPWTLKSLVCVSRLARKIVVFLQLHFMQVCGREESHFDGQLAM